MKNACNAVILQTTYPKKTQALEIAQKLVKLRLAAGVHIEGPITSVYNWEGKVTIAEEWVVSAQTRRDRISAVHDMIVSAHPYKVPYFLGLPVELASDAFLNWIETTCGD